MKITKKSMVILSVLILTLSILSGCGKSKDIELTLDNYEQYLNVSGSTGTTWDFTSGHAYNVQHRDGLKRTDGGTSFYIYRQILPTFTVEGVSTNYNYNDIQITIRIYGDYTIYDAREVTVADTCSVDKEIVIDKINVAGEGRYDEVIELPEETGTIDDYVNLNWEVVGISGTVTPVN